jgi:hypothetical protein
VEPSGTLLVVVPVAERGGMPAAGPARPRKAETMGDTAKAQSAAAGLKERLGAVFEEIFALGRRAGRDEGYREGVAEGARTERERIHAMLGQAPPRQEAPAGEPARDGVPGGPEAAQKVLAAEAAKATGAITKITKVLATETAKAAGRLFDPKTEKGRRPLPASADGESQEVAALVQSLEQRCRAEWEREPRLQAEYGTLEAYTAFIRQRGSGSAPIL